LKGELIESIAQGVFSLQSNELTRNKHIVDIRKIVSKLIKKLGLKQVKHVVPAEHHKLITYIERERRKRINKKKKDQIKELLGEVPEVKEKNEESEDDEEDE